MMVSLAPVRSSCTPLAEGYLATKLPCETCGSSDAGTINDDGFFHCFSCKEHHKAEDVGGVPAAGPARKQAAGLLDVDWEGGVPKRGLTEETCRKFGYGWATFKDDFVQVAPYVREGQVIAQKIRTVDKDFMILGDTKKLPLFGQHLWSGSGKMIVVTEGEIDCLSVSQLQDNKWPVVSLPTGAAGAAKDLARAVEFLSGYEKVVLMFDEDDAGRAGLEAAAQVLPPGKAFVAKLPLKDANECLKAGRGQDVRNAIWNASPWRPDAVLAGRDLLARVKAYKGPEGLPWPFPGLAKALPVMPLSKVVTLVAGTGSGKTTLCRCLEHWIITHDQPIGILHLEDDSPEQTALGIVGYHVGKRLDLDPKQIPEADLDRAFAETAGREGVFFYDSFGSMDFDALLSKIRFLATAEGCRYIVLDHLSIVVSGLDVPDERKALDVGMTRITQLANELGICIILVCHLKRTNGKAAENGGEVSLQDLRGTQAIAQLSAIVIALERDQQAEGDGGLLTTIRLLKNRLTGLTGPAAKLLYDRKTGRYVEVPLTFGEEEVRGDEFDDETSTDEEIPF